MNVKKGNPGYLDSRLKREWIKLLLEAAVIAGLLITGYITTGTRLNLLTLVAVLGCLPASKVLVGIIMRLPHKSVARKTAEEIQEKAAGLQTVFDLVFTSADQIMPVDCIVIERNTICGYTGHVKTDVPYTEAHIRRILLGNAIDKVNVKIFRDYSAFLNRIGELKRIRGDEASGKTKREEEIRQIILNISL